MSVVRVVLGDRSYDIAINEPGSFAAFVAERCGGRRAYLFADFNVAGFAEKLQDQLSEVGFAVRLATVPPGESSKCLEQFGVLLTRLAQAEADRHTIVIAIGGGVVGDLAGFAAATFNRGLPLIMVPTTLLAMVDSAVGGKVGINLPEGKNLVGAFHQPRGVWIDVDSLVTLPENEYRSGFAEVVKYGMIYDEEFFRWIEANVTELLARRKASLERVVERCCAIKAEIVSADEREESGRRIVLNFGHTFAHAFETCVGYANLLHGEAVSIGMVAACRLAHELRMIPVELTDRLATLLRSLSLPTHLTLSAGVEDCLAAMARDKKRGENSKVRFVLPSSVGSVEVRDDVPVSIVKKVLETVGARP